MRTIRIKLYKFSELGREAKILAIANEMKTSGYPLKRVFYDMAKAYLLEDNEIFLQDGQLFTYPLPTVKL